MKSEYIKSLDNRAVKYAVKLKDNSRFRKSEGLMVIDGKRLCSDTVRLNMPVDTVFYTESFYLEHSDFVCDITSISKKHYTVSEAVMKKLSDTVTPQGIIAVVALPVPSVLKNEDGLLIALERISDPSNLGAIARVAEAMGARGILLSGESCDPYSQKSLRAGMGALLRLPIYNSDDFNKTLEELKISGTSIYTSVVDSTAADIRKVAFSSSRVLIIGNEANGVSKEAKSIANECVTIKMPGLAESLNASSAASILIWEMQRGEA